MKAKLHSVWVKDTKDYKNSLFLTIERTDYVPVIQYNFEFTLQDAEKLVRVLNTFIINKKLEKETSVAKIKSGF